VNVPRQSSKVGVIAGAEGFEVMGRRKTGSLDMPVAREKDEQVKSSVLKPTPFYGVDHASNHIFLWMKNASVGTLCPVLL